MNKYFTIVTFLILFSMGVVGIAQSKLDIDLYLHREFCPSPLFHPDDVWDAVDEVPGVDGLIDQGVCKDYYYDPCSPEMTPMNVVSIVSQCFRDRLANGNFTEWFEQ